MWHHLHNAVATKFVAELYLIYAAADQDGAILANEMLSTPPPSDS
jgi:hypothetical protein